MKTTLKNVFKVIVLFNFILLSSCEKDLYDNGIKNSQRESKSEIIKGKDAQHIISKLENSLNKKYKVKSVQNRITMGSVGVVNYDEIIKLTDENGKSTYTFKVDRDDSSITKFYNLILQEKAGGNIIKLLEYTMTLEFAEQFKATFNYKDFQGTLQSFTVINETPCPDNDILLVHVGQLLNDGNGGNTIGNNGNSASTYSGSSTNSTNNGSNTNSGSSTSTAASGSGGYSSVGGGGSQEYHDLLLEIDCISIGNKWMYDEEEGEWGCYTSPRHFKMAVTTENNETSSPCSPNYTVVVLTPFTKCEQHFLQNTPNKIWLANHYNTEIYQQIMDYINGDGKGCSSDREQFINQCISQMMQNPNLYTSLTPFIIEKQIDDSQLDPCTKGVFQQIKNTTQCDFANVLAKLGADTSDYNTTMVSSVAPSQKPAQTIWNSPYNYTIYISTDYSNKTKLFIALSILHELTHAYFLTLFDDYHNANPINPNTYNDFGYLFDLYVTKKYPLSQAADIQHQQMATDYADAIARALQEYQTGIPVPDNSSLEQIYSDLAYGSFLDAPIVFDALFPNGNPNRQRIINRYAAEQSGNPIAQGTQNEQTPYWSTV